MSSNFFSPRKKPSRPGDSEYCAIVLSDSESPTTVSTEKIEISVLESPPHTTDVVHRTADSSSNSQQHTTEPTFPVEEEDTNRTSPSGDGQTNMFAKFAFGGKVSALPKATKRVTAPSIIESPKKKAKTNKTWDELGEEEQQSVVNKWHSMILDDEKTTALEDRRFQLLIAALLHARCQEPVVRTAMKKLHNICDLTVDALSAVEPDDIQSAIQSLQYHNSKAKYLVKAANDIKAKFSGEVPEDKSMLTEITGIGPVFADLLAHVNTRQVHLQHATNDHLI